MNWDFISSFLRLTSHGLVGVMFWYLSALYFLANKEKGSPIIRCLATLFMVLGSFFLYIALAGYTYHLSKVAYDSIIEWVFVPSFVILFVANKFRIESLRKNGHKHMNDIRKFTK